MSQRGVECQWAKLQGDICGKEYPEPHEHASVNMGDRVIRPEAEYFPKLADREYTLCWLHFQMWAEDAWEQHGN